jgi:hypothetical protein
MSGGPDDLVRVFQRHPRALSHVRRGRVRGVPDEYHPPVHPGVQRDLLDRRTMQELLVWDRVVQAEHRFGETGEEPAEIVGACARAGRALGDRAPVRVLDLVGVRERSERDGAVEIAHSRLVQSFTAFEYRPGRSRPRRRCMRVPQFPYATGGGGAESWVIELRRQIALVATADCALRSSPRAPPATAAIAAVVVEDVAMFDRKPSHPRPRPRPPANSSWPRRAASASSSRRPRCPTSSTAWRSCSASTCTTATSCPSTHLQRDAVGRDRAPGQEGPCAPRARAGLDRAALRVLRVRRAPRARPADLIARPPRCELSATRQRSS